MTRKKAGRKLPASKTGSNKANAPVKRSERIQSEWEGSSETEPYDETDGAAEQRDAERDPDD